MGRGRNRKPRNFATFRLCPRPGAADASDRVFVRVDDNPYSVPGFADDEGLSSSTAAVEGDGGDPAVASSSSASAEDDGAPLPEHVRREILELGLPDDGYDYLAHLRELRPSLSSTGGGGSSAVFLPSRRPARSGLRADVKAYDYTRTPLASGEVAAVTASRAEEGIDLDVARMLDGRDSPAVDSGDEDLEEDFVILANEPDEEPQIEEENVSGGKEKAPQLTHEHFDSLALEDYVDCRDDCHVRDAKHELSQEVTDELKMPHSENFDADIKCRAQEPQYVAHRILESKEQIDVSCNAISECVGYAETYEVSEEQVILAPGSSEGSEVMYSTTTVSGSYLDVKKKFPKPSAGDTSMKKAIIRKGIEKLPAGYLPQRNTSSGEKQGPYKETKEEGTES